MASGFLVQAPQKLRQSEAYRRVARHHLASPLQGVETLLGRLRVVEERCAVEGEDLGKFT